MSVGSVGSPAPATQDIAKTLLGGELQNVDQTMKTAKVAMQMQLKEQEMAQTQAAVAMMTGVGANLNTVA